MEKKRMATTNNKAIPIIIIAVILVLIGGGIIISNSGTQSASDCSIVEEYDTKTKRCVLLSKTEFLEDVKSSISEQVSDKIHNDFRNGTLCIPADETPKYVGVDGCVRMFVKHYYIESYGWAWLDAQQISYANGDFSVAALGNGIITKADAEYYLGNFISVHGVISVYDGETQIKISNKAAITDVSKENTPYLTQYSALEKKYEEEIKTTMGNCYDAKIVKATTKSAKDNAYYSCSGKQRN